ncbi:MAG TPA: hypothetical protein VEY07_07750, partial [Thermoplasmata archaeon]|nr:hypothetical protein [Thermoplasmata archaeon]
MLGSGAFLGGIAFAVLLAAPFAAASGSVSFAAPYTSFTSTMSNYLSSYGCGAVAVEHGAPSWAASTGTFTMGAQTRVSGCTLTSSSGYISGSASVTSPAFAAPHRGLNVVTAVWNTSVVAHAALTISATGAYGGAYASVGAAAYLYLYDVTGGNFTFVA